jgi:hypothetical protein
VPRAAAVSGDDYVIGADQDRVDKTELGNRCGDLRDLCVRKDEKRGRVYRVVAS